jgi:hypothetical protein
MGEEGTWKRDKDVSPSIENMAIRPDLRGAWMASLPQRVA